MNIRWHGTMSSRMWIVFPLFLSTVLLLSSACVPEAQAQDGVPGWAKPQYHHHDPANRYASPDRRRDATRKELGQFKSRMRQLEGELRAWDRSSSPDRMASGDRSTGDPGAVLNNPGNPDPPDNVPLPGSGLALLTAAGAGYAIRRLRQSDGDTPLDDSSQDLPL